MAAGRLLRAVVGEPHGGHASLAPQASGSDAARGRGVGRDGRARRAGACQEQRANRARAAARAMRRLRWWSTTRVPMPIEQDSSPRQRSRSRNRSRSHPASDRKALGGSGGCLLQPRQCALSRRPAVREICAAGGHQEDGPRRSRPTIRRCSCARMMPTANTTAISSSGRLTRSGSRPIRAEAVARAARAAALRRDRRQSLHPGDRSRRRRDRRRGPHRSLHRRDRPRSCRRRLSMPPPELPRPVKPQRRGPRALPHRAQRVPIPRVLMTMRSTWRKISGLPGK